MRSKWVSKKQTQVTEPSKWVAKTQTTATPQKLVPATCNNNDALRTTPFLDQQCPNEDALRTVPFEQSGNESFDDEDAMSTSAGSSDLGLGEGNSRTSIEGDEDEQDTNLQEISRSLLLLFRRHVPTCESPQYRLRTADLSECAPAEPEMLLPPGVLLPPGLEDNFHCSEYPMFRAVAMDPEELQSLLTKISLELDVAGANSTVLVSEKPSCLQDWTFEEPPAAPADSYSDDLKDDLHHLSMVVTQVPEDADCVSEWIANLPATAIGMPLMMKHNSDNGMTISDLYEVVGPPEHFNSSIVDCGMVELGTASEWMAWPQCYEVPCTDWFEHGAGVMPSFEWYSPPWNTLNGLCPSGLPMQQFWKNKNKNKNGQWNAKCTGSF